MLIRSIPVAVSYIKKFSAKFLLLSLNVYFQITACIARLVCKLKVVVSSCDEGTQVKKRKEEEAERVDNNRIKANSGPSEEETNRWVQKGRKVWKRAAREHEDASYLNAFVNAQGGAADDDHHPQEEQTSAVSGGAQEQLPEDYERYYKHFLSYYQQKYGVSQSGVAEAEAEAEAKKMAKNNSGTKKTELTTTPSNIVDPESEPKKPNALGLIAGYSDSDSE